jgi:hypothetical protein
MHEKYVEPSDKVGKKEREGRSYTPLGMSRGGSKQGV